MANLLDRLARRLTRGPQGPQRADAPRRTVLPDAPVPDAVPALPPIPPPAGSADAVLPDAPSAAAPSSATPSAAAPSTLPILEPDPQALLPAGAPALSGPRVFISHSTADNAFGLRLAADLRAALGGDTTVWFDASGGLQGGDVWLDQIAAELTGRDVFLLILSPAALASTWVQDELRMAWKQRNAAPGGKVIIPVLYQPCAVPEYLATIQYISFLPPRPYTDAFAEVLAAVRAGKTRDVPLERQATTVLGPPNDAALLPSPERFVGRADDLAWLMGRLRAGGANAITALRGLGGIGKTTLAGVAVRQLQQEGRFPDGIAVVLCQGMADPAEVLRRVLIRFDPLRRAPEATELHQLQDLAQVTLRGKQALVVLDNVEPALPVASVVAPLRTADVTVLLTARQTLPGAAVSAEASRALDLLTAEEALDLFVGALGRSGVSALTPAERMAAEEIVATLGHHTLAVKLAGAYAAAERRDLGALARELANPEQGLALPGDDETPEAVRRSFALSLDSLPLDAQQLFAGLAAFATPECGRQATLALGSALGQAHPETSVHLLVVRALTEPSVSGALPEGSDRERLRLHPLLRAFAQGLFHQWSAAEQETATLAVAQYLATYAEAHQTDYAVLAADEGNLTGALEWAYGHGQAALVADLAHGLCLFWRDRGRYREGVRFLAWGVAAAEANRLPQAHAAARRQEAELRLVYGQMLVYSGQPEAGATAVQRSLESFRGAQDRHGEGKALSALGDAALWRGEVATAGAYLDQALAIAREVSDRQNEGTDLSCLGWVAVYRGQLEAAEAYLKQALAIHREVGDRQHAGVDLSRLGRVALSWRQLDTATAYLEQALAIHREVGDRLWEAQSQATLGQVAEARDDLARAETLYRQSWALAAERGLGPLIAEAQLALGRLLAERLNRRDEGCVVLREAARRFAEMGMPEAAEAQEAAERLGCAHETS